MEGQKLRQVRLDRGWSRAKVEQMTGGRISEPSLERWEKGLAFPREDSIVELCKLFDFTPEQLGLVRDTMALATSHFSREASSMSEIIRRAVFSDLGSKLSGFVSTWPKRNYRYSELQEAINKAIVEHSDIAIDRRSVLMSACLVPLQISGGTAKKTDADTLLTHCAAGIAAAWYLRRGKDLAFVSDLASSYISLLQPLAYSQSETYRKASATLLSQCFRLKGSIANALESCDHAMPCYQEAIRYGLVAENNVEQALANRMMAFSHRAQGARGYEQALSYAETAYGLTTKDTPKVIRSFVTSGLALCQATNGKTNDAKTNLAEAYNLFGDTVPALSIYTESNLLAITAEVHRYSGLWQESVDLWEKSTATPDITTLGGIQARIQYTETEVSRDDKTRNMDLCIKLLTEAITGAKELDSKRYIAEATQAYTLCRIAWPQENAVKQLGRDHFGG